MGDNIYSHKYSDLAWLLWNEIEGLANTFSEGNQRVKAAVERSFDNAFNELIDEPATAKVVKTRPARMPVATAVASKTLPATRTVRTVAVRPSTPPAQVSARTSFIDKSLMRGMKFTEMTNDWLREAMNIALNGAMLTSSNKNTIQQAVIKIAEEAILPSVQARGLDMNDVRGKIQASVGQFMMFQGTRF